MPTPIGMDLYSEEGAAVYINGECIGYVTNGKAPVLNARVIDNGCIGDFDGDTISLSSSDIPNTTLKQLSSQIKNLKSDLEAIKDTDVRKFTEEKLQKAKKDHSKLSELLQDVNLKELYDKINKKRKVEIVAMDITRDMMLQNDGRIRVRAEVLVDGIRIGINSDFPSYMVDTIGKARQVIIDYLS